MSSYALLDALPFRGLASSYEDKWRKRRSQKPVDNVDYGGRALVGVTDFALFYPSTNYGQST